MNEKEIIQETAKEYTEDTIEKLVRKKSGDSGSSW